MTLDEMDQKLAEEALKEAERQSNCGAAGLTKLDPLRRSFFCEHYHHSDCRWKECKCSCHDTYTQGDWMDWMGMN